MPKYLISFRAKRFMVCLAMLAGVVHAQSSTTPADGEAAPAAGTVAGNTESEALYQRPSDVGHSTERLLAMQRTTKGQQPRSIDGELASRSYQRYLKSFETAIPEQFETGMNLKKQ